MPYATAEELLARCREELVARLAVDDGAPITRQELLVHPHVLRALEDASAEVDAALATGGRYPPEELAHLTGSPAAMLSRITCGLAVGCLLARSGGHDQAMYATYIRVAREYLERLQQGEAILALPEHQAAGLTDVDGPTALDLAALDRLPQRTRRYYPER